MISQQCWQCRLSSKWGKLTRYHWAGGQPVNELDQSEAMKHSCAVITQPQLDISSRHKLQEVYIGVFLAKITSLDLNLLENNWFKSQSQDTSEISQLYIFPKSFSTSSFSYLFALWCKTLFARHQQLSNAPLPTRSLQRWTSEYSHRQPLQFHYACWMRFMVGHCALWTPQNLRSPRGLW